MGEKKDWIAKGGKPLGIVNNFDRHCQEDIQTITKVVRHMCVKSGGKAVENKQQEVFNINNELSIENERTWGEGGEQSHKENRREDEFENEKV